MYHYSTTQNKHFSLGSAKRGPKLSMLYRYLQGMSTYEDTTSLCNLLDLSHLASPETVPWLARLSQESSLLTGHSLPLPRASFLKAVLLAMDGIWSLQGLTVCEATHFLDCGKILGVCFLARPSVWYDPQAEQSRASITATRNCHIHYIVQPVVPYSSTP